MLELALHKEGEKKHREKQTDADSCNKIITIGDLSTLLVPFYLTSCVVKECVSAEGGRHEEQDHACQCGQQEQVVHVFPQ